MERARPEGSGAIFGQIFAGVLVERIEHAFHDREMRTAQRELSGVFLLLNPREGAQIGEALPDCREFHRQLRLSARGTMLGGHGLARLVEELDPVGHVTALARFGIEEVP